MLETKMNQSQESCLINFQDQNGPTLLWLQHKGKDNGSKSRTNLASVGSVLNDTRKVKVLSLPETINEKSFRAKALHRELVVGLVVPAPVKLSPGKKLTTGVWQLGGSPPPNFQGFFI